MMRDYAGKRLAFYQDRTRPGRPVPFLVVCLRGRARARPVAILLSESAGSRDCGERSGKGAVDDCEGRRGKLAPLIQLQYALVDYCCRCESDLAMESARDLDSARNRACAHRAPSKSFS
jgi:hypothetical protein